MSDAPVTKIDTPNPHLEAQAKLSADAAVPKGSSPPTAPASNDAHVAAGNLPSLAIDGADSGNTHWGSGAMAVAGDILTGAKNQITQNPGQVAESGAIGLGIGAVAGVVADGVVAAGAAVGVTLAAPEVLAGAAVLGAAYGAYELYQHADSWFNAAKVVSNKQDYTPTQVSQADAELQGVGAGGVNVAAGFGGAVAGSYIAGALAAGAGGADAPAAAAPGLDTTPAATPPVDAPATPAPAGATPPVDAPQTPATPAGATPPVDAPQTPATPAGATPPLDAPPPATTPPGDGPATPAQLASTQPGDTPGEKPVTGDTRPAEVASTVDLNNPAANTNADTLGKAYRDAIETAKEDGKPLTLIDNTKVTLTDGAGNSVKTSQAEVLYKQLQEAYPENHFVFSKPDLNPGDPGYTESPAVPVTQDNLHISSKESAITVGTDTTLPDGTVLPAGTKFAVGTTYDGNVVKSALPDGKVWATKPDGTYVQVAGEGQSTAVPSDALSTDPKQIGQVVNIKNDHGVPNNILVRSDAKAVDPDGKPLLDAYPVTDDTLTGAYKPGTQPGYYAPLGKSADHFKLPPNITVVSQMGQSEVTASGEDGYYFMKSGYGDAPDATAKNYSGPTIDSQSAAELARLRAAQGLS